MSTSILYLAIVAIWAVFLVPAWVRRPHASRGDVDADAGTEADFEADGVGEDAEGAAGLAGAAGPAAGPAAGHGDGGEYVDDGEAGWFAADQADAGYGAEPIAGADAYGEAGRSRWDDRDGSQNEWGHGASDAHDEWERGSGHLADSFRHPVSHADPADAGSTPAAPRTGAGQAAGSELSRGGPPGAQRSEPAQSRQQMLRARRRMLAILVSLTAMTAMVAAGGLVSWWICLPPTGMLVLYVLLLREVALAEAEIARKREAWEARMRRNAAGRPDGRSDSQPGRQADRQADRQPDGAGERTREGGQAPRSPLREHGDRTAAAAGRTAEIIDISGRVGDQLYDQYADAAVRAVGD